MGHPHGLMRAAGWMAGTRTKHQEMLPLQLSQSPNLLLNYVLPVL